MANNRSVPVNSTTELSKALEAIGLNANSLIFETPLQPDQIHDQDDPVSILKHYMKYLEKEKYPTDAYEVTTCHAVIDNRPVQVFHVNYKVNDNKSLTESQIDRIDHASVKLRMSSILAGTIYMLEKSPNFLTDDPEQREKTLERLKELSNILLKSSTLPRHQSQESIVDDYIGTIAKEISMTCNIDNSEAIRSIRNAEKYFIAEYNQQRVLVFKTDRSSMNETSNIQIDIPFGNQISDDQKIEYTKIHSTEPPAWFSTLPVWEQDWLTARIPKSISDDWSEFTSIFQSSAMQHLPGIKNARHNYLLEVQQDQSFTLLSKSFKTATIVPYEMPIDQQQEHTRQNSYQLLDQLQTHAKNQFDEIWGSTNLPDHIKPLVLVNSLLSDTTFSAADSNLSKFQDEAIKSYAVQHAGSVNVVNGNEPVNVFRALAVQGKSRWAYANQVIKYARTLHDHLNNDQVRPKLNADQIQRLKLSGDVIKQLESLSKLSHSSLLKYNIVKHRNFEAFKTAYISILAESLGGAVSTNCKSGKDRTGLDELYRHAILLYYQRYQKLPSYTDEGMDRKNFKKIYIEVFNTMKAQEAAASNTPGSFGIKDSALMLCRDIAVNLGQSYSSSNLRANMNKPARFLRDEAKQAQELVSAFKKTSPAIPTENTASISDQDRLRQLSAKKPDLLYRELEILSQSYKQEAEQIYYSLDRSPLEELSIKIENLKQAVELLNQEHPHTKLAAILNMLDVVMNRYVANQHQSADQVMAIGKSSVIVPLSEVGKHLHIDDDKQADQTKSGITQQKTTPKTVPIIDEKTAKVNTLELQLETSKSRLFRKKDAEIKKIEVQSVQTINDNKSSLQSHFNPNDINLLSKEGYLVWAISEIKNYKALCTNREDPMEIFGSYPKDFVKYALLYCAYQEKRGRGNEYQIINNTKYQFKFTDHDIKSFEKLLIKNQHQISAYSTQNQLSLNREQKLESRIEIISVSQQPAEMPAEPSPVKNPGPVVSQETQKILMAKTAQEQLKNDAEQWGNYLTDNNSTKQKQLLMKRIFALVDSASLSTTSGTPSNSSHLNLASTLSHGGRLVIQVPPIQNGENPHTLVDSLLDGIDIDQKDRFGNRLVFSRPFASHSLEIENGEVREALLKTTGIQGDYTTLLKDSLNKRHFGMNIGLGYDGAKAEDGTNGHVYFYWMEPTTTSPGGLMIGVETAAPGKTNPYGATHGASATQGALTPTGGTKFTSPAFAKHKEAGLVLSPDGGMRADITRENFSRVMSAIENAETIITPKKLEENIKTQKYQPPLRNENSLPPLQKRSDSLKEMVRSLSQKHLNLGSPGHHIYNTRKRRSSGEQVGFIKNYILNTANEILQRINTNTEDDQEKIMEYRKQLNEMSSEVARIENNATLTNQEKISEFHKIGNKLHDMHEHISNNLPKYNMKYH